MKVKVELELEEAAMAMACIREVAKRSPIGLLAQPLLNIFNEEIKKAQESKDGNDTTS